MYGILGNNWLWIGHVKYQLAVLFKIIWYIDKYWEWLLPVSELTPMLPTVLFQHEDWSAAELHIYKGEGTCWNFDYLCIGDFVKQLFFSLAYSDMGIAV